MARAVPSLSRLTEAATLLGEESTVLELAVRAMHEACPRGIALGFTARGAGSGRMGALRILREGSFLDFSLPHLAYVRTPAYDVADVPAAQRNRWVEPFREGIATHEGWRKSTLYPFLKHLGVLEQGRVAVCSGARQVALAGAAVPEGTEFTAEERRGLTATASALVVPLRLAAMLGEAQLPRTPLEELLDRTTDAVFALDARGGVVATSRLAFERLRLDRSLPELLKAATRGRGGAARSVTRGTNTVHLSPSAEPGVRWLGALDAAPPEGKLALTPRQRELLELLEKGLTNAELASALRVAAPTVKTTLERLYRRAGVGNRVELLAWWRA